MSSGPPPSPADRHDEIWTLGKYKIQKQIGAGGMGAVYLAVDQQLRRTVALKVLPKDKANNKTLVRRFKAEGQAGAQLEHPNIVAVFESGEIDGYLYLAMEYVEGLDAYELLKKRGVLPAKRSLEIIKQVVQALDHAYERSVVHRDIKPSNLLIRERDGLVKLADMGLARVLEDETESIITKAGTTVGTVDYMSPEQARDSKLADTRSDIYSLGCTWYHLVAGKAPYPDGDLMNKLRAHAMQPVPDPRAWNENIPSGMVAVIQRMMAKKPDDRYQTPRQLLADLNSPTLLRNDVSADQLLLLAASQSSKSPPDGEAQEGLSSLPASKRKSVTRSGPQPRIPAEREEPEPDADTPSGPQKFKKAKTSDKRPTSSRETLPPRSAETNPDVETNGKKAKPERALPGRIDQPLLSENPSPGLDPETIKLALLALIVICGLGGIGYGLYRFSQSDGNNSGAANPYAKGEAAPDSPPVNPGIVIGQPAGTAESNLPTNGAPLVPSTIGVPEVPTGTGPPPTLAPDKSPFGGIIAADSNSVPPWVTDSRVESANSPAQIVRMNDPGQHEYAGLEQALTSATGDVVIELADVGPHVFPAITKKTAGRWIVRGAQGVNPLLTIATGSVQIQQGVLDLEGVHLVFSSDRPDNSLRVGAGTVALRNSTATHLSPSAEALIMAEAQGKVVIENSFLRTQGSCTPIVLRGSQSGLAVGNSLILAGNARSIQVQSQDAAQDARSVILVRTALLSGQSTLSLTHHGRQPPALDLQLRQSWLAYVPGHNADAVGIEFQGWPQESPGLDKPRAASVSWKAAQSALINWPHWAALNFADKSPALDIRDDESWRGFWRSSSSPGSLIVENGILESLAHKTSQASLAQLEAALLPITSQLTDIGPRWSTLPKPPQSAISNLQAFDQMARLPAAMESPDPGTVLRYDLKNPALGRFLNSEKVPDGSTVIAFGSGLRTIDPFVLKQKRVQLVIEQSEGVPLVLQPGYKTEPGATRPPAWFAVEDGQLTLENGLFRMLAGNRNYPERFLQMSGGLVSLRQIRAEGIDATFPLIDLLPSQGHAPPQLLLDRTHLAAMRNAIRVSAAESIQEFRNSIVSSSAGTAIVWDAGAEGSQTFVNHSTLAGAKFVFQVLPLGGKTPLELYSERSVFHGGGMLSLDTDATALSWWGRQNAYSNAMKSFLQTAGAASTHDFQTNWVQGWGVGHELNPVQGANHVLLPQLPTTVIDTTPDSFKLHEDCLAAKSGLGVPISQVGPHRVPPKPASDTKPNTPQKGPAPGF